MSTRTLFLAKGIACATAWQQAAERPVGWRARPTTGETRMSVVDIITILIHKLIVAALQLLDAVLKLRGDSDSSRTERATAPLSPIRWSFRFSGTCYVFYDTLNDA